MPFPQPNGKARQRATIRAPLHIVCSSTPVPNRSHPYHAHALPANPRIGALTFAAMMEKSVRELHVNSQHLVFVRLHCKACLGRCRVHGVIASWAPKSDRCHVCYRQSATRITKSRNPLPMCFVGQPEIPVDRPGKEKPCNPNEPPNVSDAVCRQ